MENKSVIVIGAQGKPSFGKYQLQAWVENINRALTLKGFEVSVFVAGDKRYSYLKNNVKVFISNRLNFFRDSFSLDILLKLLFIKKPTFAIIHGLQHFLTLSSLLVLSIRKIPVIIIVHGLYKIQKNSLSSLLDSILKFFMRFLCSSYFLVALTNYDKSLIIKEWGIPEERIRICHSFLYLNSSEIRLIQKLRDNYCHNKYEEESGITFLYIGRLELGKRVDYLIKTFYTFLRSLRECKNIKLIIVGDGSMRSLIIDIIKRLNLEKYIYYLGPIPESRKWLTCLTADAFILTSENEGLPRVFFEAFATGCIVIAPNICGLNEVICDGINGYLFNNEKELLDVLHLIVNNKEKILEMGYNNYKLTIKKMIFESNIDGILGIINDFLQKNGMC